MFFMRKKKQFKEQKKRKNILAPRKLQGDDCCEIKLNLSIQLVFDLLIKKSLRN